MSVVVIGRGLAGTVAAARLADLGVVVEVIADRPGATIHHGGGWLLGLETLAGYGVPAPRIDEALEFAEAGLPGLALEDGPFTLLDVDGVPREVDVAPASHAAGADLPPGSAVVHLAGVGHHFAEMCPHEALTVDWPEPGWFGRSFAAIAMRIERDPAAFDAFCAAVIAAVDGQAGLLLPPVLGISAPERLRAALVERLGIPVAEALGTLPSTAGLRLDQALRSWLEVEEIPIRQARVRRIEPGVIHVGETQIRARAVVLATGGPLGGGVDAFEGFREPLAGLRIAPELPFDWTHAIRPDRPDDAPLFRAGVPVDASFRPTRHDGSAVHPKLFAVGDLISGADGVADRCGSGLALISGYVAAEAVAAALGD